MLCEECNQNPATVVITVLMNGEKRTRNLCQDCVGKIQSSFQQGDIHSFLSSIMSSIAKGEKEESLTCSRCHLPYEVFKLTGKLGCAQCYADFRNELKPLLQQIHGQSQHTGRIPEVRREEVARSDEIASLRREMDQAVAIENFELAADLRDKLKALSVAKEGETL